MKVYMLKDAKTGLYFKRGAGTWRTRWVVQRYAEVWTSKNGPNAAKRYAKEPVIVVLEAKEVVE